jgi:hypothetical protein
MDEKVKAKWLEALRSGKYKQGRQGLRKVDSFCCLGVLCDLLNPNGWRQITDNDLIYSFNGELGVIDKRLARSIGVEEFQDILVEMNDEKQNSFSEIADYIEANL